MSTTNEQAEYGDCPRCGGTGGVYLPTEDENELHKCPDCGGTGDKPDSLAPSMPPTPAGDERATGATEADIERAVYRKGVRTINQGRDTGKWSDAVRDALIAKWSPEFRSVACDLVPPGYVIAPAPDVLSPELKAAIGRVVQHLETGDYGYGIEIEPDLAVLRAAASGTDGTVSDEQEGPP